MSQAVRQLLDAADARLQKLDREAKRISDEMRDVRTKRAAYAEVLAALGEPVSPLPGDVERGAPDSRRKRGLSGFWMAALTEMGRVGQLSVADVIGLSDLVGAELTAAAIRSQLSYYSMGTRVLVRRVSPGVYELTDAGKALIAQKSEDPAGTGSSDATNVVDGDHTRSAVPGEGTT